MKKLLKYKYVFFLVVIGLMILPKNVMALENETFNYGVKCEYGDYYFYYQSNSEDEVAKITTNFNELGIDVEKDRPASAINSSSEQQWLLSKGFIDTSRDADGNVIIHFTCPYNAFGTNVGNRTRTITGTYDLSAPSGTGSDANGLFVANEDDDNYNFSCKYRDANGETYWLIYTGDTQEQPFEIEDSGKNFGNKFGIKFPETLTINARSSYYNVPEFQKLGLVTNEQWTCPTKDPFGISGLVLEARGCNARGCSLDDVPTVYAYDSCTYRSTTNDDSIHMWYQDDPFGDQRLEILYPDGTRKIISGTALYDYYMPGRGCEDIYYIPSSKKIIRARSIADATDDDTLWNVCFDYDQNNVQHFCDGTCDYQQMVCPSKCNLTDIPEGLPIFTNNLINLVKILIPILLIIMGMFDFVRAVMSSDEKQMKEAQNRFIRRVLAAVIIFFVVAIVQFTFRIIGHSNKNIVGCIDCFVNGNCNITYYEDDEYDTDYSSCRDQAINKCTSLCENLSDFTAMSECTLSCFNGDAGWQSCEKYSKP